MRVIAWKALREFWATEPAAKAPLGAWYKVVSGAAWRTFADVRRTFNSADPVGNCVVFNVGGNKYRVIGRVFYADTRPGRVFILRVMTHAEYDKNKWPDQCGCHSPSPKKERKKPAPGLRPVRAPRGKAE